MRCKASFYMGGGTESKLKEFDLQRFANVSNPYEAIINSNIITNGSIQQPLVNLSYYARDNIANYGTITTIPQENIGYLSSGLAASSCESMFYDCRQLISIPWNEFNIDTSKVTNMSYMFQDCTALTSLNLSSFDTSQCTSMSIMFQNCTALTSLNLSSFDTSKVTKMIAMFQHCTALTSLDLSSFDTSKMTSMYSMFYGCGSLREIICPNGFDMSSCIDIDRMFTDCNSYSGEPLHFKNVPRNLDFTHISGTEGKHYVIDSYLD